MNRLFLKHNSVFLFLLFVSSCYTYSGIRVINRLYIDNNQSSMGSLKDAKREVSKKDIRDEDDKAAGEKAVKKETNSPSRGRTYKFYQKKYFAVSYSLSPISKVNNKGVEYALAGRFKEAALLFNEVIKENGNFGAAYNNLGIIYEIFSHHEEAFEMYSRACLLEPDNDYFQRNFLYKYEYVKEKK
jgi:tetratricopeptide (TPR) repeat protein